MQDPEATDTPVGFSGDTVITWESLKFQPYFTANASNIGFGWWSHDIGGHMLGYRDDDAHCKMGTAWSLFTNEPSAQHRQPVQWKRTMEIATRS